jgi:hypothetical protein
VAADGFTPIPGPYCPGIAFVPPLQSPPIENCYQADEENVDLAGDGIWIVATIMGENSWNFIGTHSTRMASSSGTEPAQ